MPGNYSGKVEARVACYKNIHQLYQLQFLQQIINSFTINRYSSKTMLAALFFYTAITIMLSWLIISLVQQFRARQNSPQDQSIVSVQSKLIKSKKRMMSVNDGSDPKNNHENRKRESSTNTGLTQKKYQRQNEEQQNKLQLKISSNCSDNGDLGNQQEFQEYIQYTSTQKNNSQIEDPNKDPEEERSNSRGSRLMMNTNYLTAMTTVQQLSDQYRPSERDMTFIPEQQEHDIEKSKMLKSEHKSQPNYQFEGQAESGADESGIKCLANKKAQTEKDNESKRRGSEMSIDRIERNKKTSINGISSIEMFRDPNRENLSEINAHNVPSKDPEEPQRRNYSEIDKSASDFKPIQNFKEKKKQYQSKDKPVQEPPQKNLNIQLIQANRKEDASKPIVKSDQNKHSSMPSHSQSLKKSQDEPIRSQNTLSEQKAKQESNMDSLYDLTLSKDDDIKQESKGSKAESRDSDVPLILVHETFNEIMKQGPCIYKYDKNNLNQLLSNQQKNLPNKQPTNSNLSIKQLEKQSLSERSQALYKKDLTKLLQQIDSFFMNNSSAERSNDRNQKFLESNQYQQATQNYDYSSGAYYYSDQKSGSKSDIISQSIQPRDFKRPQKADTEKQFATSSNQRGDSRAGQSNLNISSKKQNSASASLQVESKKQNTIKTVNNNLSRPPSARKTKKRKKVSKTEKFKLKHNNNGEEDEVEESDYPYDEDEDLESMISYNKVQEDIITQLETKIKKLMNTVSIVQNRHDGLLKQLTHDKEVRDTLLKKCQQLQEQKKGRQNILIEGVDSNTISEDKKEVFVSYIRQIDRYKEENEKLKEQNEKLKGNEEQYKKQRQNLQEQRKEFQDKYEEEKNNVHLLIEGYEEKIKSQGEMIEDSLKKIRQLEGLNQSDDEIDDYDYYVDSHDSLHGFEQKSGTSSERRKRLVMRKSDLQKLKVGSKQSTPTSSFRVKQNRLLEIAQQVSHLEGEYNKAKQQATNLRMQLQQTQELNEELKQSLTAKQEQYLIKLAQMQEQINSINNKAQISLEKYENLLKDYEGLKQQLVKKQNEIKSLSHKKVRQISTTSNENTVENSKILKLYHQYKDNNDNLCGELEFCQQQIQQMFQNQQELRQQNKQLLTMISWYQEQQEKEHPVNSHARIVVKYGKSQQYQQIKKKYLEMKRERVQKEKYYHHTSYNPQLLREKHRLRLNRNFKTYTTQSQENNEEQIYPMEPWRRSYAFNRHKESYPGRDRSSYITSPKSQKNMSINSKKSDHLLISKSKQRQIYQAQIKNIFQLNSQFLTQQAHPYIQFLNSTLLSHRIVVKHSYKIFSSINETTLDKTSLKLAISNIQNILFLCKIKDSGNKGKMVAGFSRLALTTHQAGNYKPRKTINDINSQKQGFGILFDLSNFLSYPSHNKYHLNKSIASVDQNMIVWGYNELFIDLDQPGMLYANFNEEHEGGNNIYWRNKEQIDKFIDKESAGRQGSHRRVNVKWVSIQGFEIFGLST